MGDGWETARKPDRPAVLELGADGLVKVSADGYSTVSARLRLWCGYDTVTARLVLYGDAAVPVCFWYRLSCVDSAVVVQLATVRLRYGYCAVGLVCFWFR